MLAKSLTDLASSDFILPVYAEGNEVLFSTLFFMRFSKNAAFALTDCSGFSYDSSYAVFEVICFL